MSAPAVPVSAIAFLLAVYWWASTRIDGARTRPALAVRPRCPRLPTASENGEAPGLRSYWAPSRVPNRKQPTCEARVDRVGSTGPGCRGENGRLLVGRRVAGGKDPGNARLAIPVDDHRARLVELA